MNARNILTRMQDVFFSIMNNWKEAANAMSLMENSADTLQNSYDKYLETTTAHLQTFKSAFAQLGADTFQTGFLNDIVDLGTGLIHVVDGIMKVINAVGGLKTVLLGIGGIIATIKADAIMAFVTSLPGNIAKLASPITSLIGIISRIPAVYQSMTSGTAVAVQGTSRLSAALQGLGISASAAQLAIGALVAVVAAISLVHSAIEKAEQKARESAQNGYAEAEEKLQKFQSLEDAYIQATAARAAGDEMGFASAVASASEALEGKAAAFDAAAGSASAYLEYLKGIRDEELSGALDDAQNARIEAGKLLQGDAWSGWSGSKITVELNEQMTGVEDHVRALDIVNDKMSDYIDIGRNCQEIEPINFDSDHADADAIVDYYYALGDALAAMRAAEKESGEEGSITNSDLYTNMDSVYKDLTEDVKKYTDAKLDEQSIEWKQSNDIPTTIDGYIQMQDAILDAMGATGSYREAMKSLMDLDYSGFLNDIGYDKFKAVSEKFKELYGDASKEYDDWYLGLDDKEKQIVFDLMVTTDTADYTLDDWKSAIESYEVPEEDKISFSDFFKSEDDGSFKKTVDDYVSQMKVLGDAKEKLLDGSFSDSDLKELIDTFPKYADKFAGGAENVSSAVDSIMNSLTGHPETVNNISNTTDALDNLLNEEQKIKDWGLEDFGSALDTSGNSFIQSQFGNVDMDARTIIAWSDELKTRYRNALDSWDYDPEIGGIDTVFGGSDRFGEDVLEHGVEVAFTPIMNTENGAEFLSKDTVYDYIESLVGASVKDGTFSEDTLLALDKQGMQIGDKFVSGLIAAADEGLNYDNNGNWAETVGRLMHFSGDFGAIAIAMSDVEKEAAAAGMSVEDYINSMSETSEVTEEATGIMKFFDEAIDKCATDEDRAALEAYRDAILGIAQASEDSETTLEKMSKASTTLTKGISEMQSAINGQQNGKSIDVDTFNSDALKDYRGALEMVNGTMQLNADKCKEIAKAKAQEQIATNNTNKAIGQSKYLENARQIEKYRQQLRDANFAQGETAESVQASIDALVAENSAIADACSQYDLLSASIREAIGEYQNWLNAQSSSDYGDMANDTVGAINKIRNTFTEGTDDFGNFGSKKFEAALDFIIPESVDSTDLAAIESYMNDFKKYLTFDDKGNSTGLNIDQFLQDSVSKGLMSYSDDDGFRILGEQKMEDFAEGLGLSMGVVQAMFDELQLKGAKFDWTDEAVKTVGDLAVEAGEAAEALRGVEGNEDLKIKMDVSDLSTAEEQISALDETIAEMESVKAKPGVDASEIDNANAVIQYCLTQKQLLSQPDVMRVDTSQVEGDISNAISLLQQFQNAQNELEMQAAVGVDTTEAQANVQAIADQIAGLPESVKTDLSINSTSIDSIQESINNLSAEIMVDVGVNEEAITGYNPETKQCDVIYNPDTALLPESFDSIDRTVNYVADTSSLPSSFTTITRYVNYVKTGDVSVNGTAHAGGTARAGGDWGTAPGGETLVGELG